jgi:hypothetical protein
MAELVARYFDLCDLAESLPTLESADWDRLRIIVQSEPLKSPANLWMRVQSVFGQCPLVERLRIMPYHELLAVVDLLERGGAP